MNKKRFEIGSYTNIVALNLTHTTPAIFLRFGGGGGGGGGAAGTAIGLSQLILARMKESSPKAF